MSPVTAASDLDLKNTFRAADPALLLAATVSITGDHSRIDEFAPHFEYGIANMSVVVTLPDPHLNRLVDWALSVYQDQDAYDRSALDDEVFARLAHSLIGLPVTPDQVPFLREQGGFETFVPTVARSKRPPKEFTVAIIGAGMAGVAMAVACKQAGFTFQVFERNEAIGGVWLQNTYPGVGVDTHSKYYSLAFDINAEWTNSYPEGGEFRDYLARVADKFGVTDKFTFGADVTELVWDEQNAQWLLTYVKDGVEHKASANAVVTAAGYLTRPQIPQVPGVDTFAGASFHSAEWDHEFDFTGKRVAVIGTGCTSVQIVDALAPKIKSLSLFQRQPHWVTPSADETTIPETERWLLQHYPSYSRWARLRTYLVIGDVNYGMVRYDADWAAGHDLSISEANDSGMQIALAHLESTFADRPDLLEKLRPGFAFMGKRPIRDPGTYYETLKKSTTEVVTTGLAAVTEKGPVDGDGTVHEVDAIVYATGFSLDFLRDRTIIGRDGEKLSDTWAETPRAYLGCQVPGFPNLFITSGPNANPSHGGGHNFSVEATVHYIIECLQTLIENDAAAMEPTPEALERWDAEVRELLADSIWARETRASTYYRNGKGEVVLASPLLMEEYWTRLRAPALDDIHLRSRETSSV